MLFVQQFIVNLFVHDLKVGSFVEYRGNYIDVIPSRGIDKRCPTILANEVTLSSQNHYFQNRRKKESKFQITKLNVLPTCDSRQ